VSLSPQRRGRRRLVIPRGSLPDGQPPYAAVLALDRGGHVPRHLFAVVVAVFAHSLIAAAVVLQHQTVAHPPRHLPHPDIQAVLQRAPAPAPSPSPPSPPPEPRKAAPQLAARSPRSVRRTAPPAPAQVGRVITQVPDNTGPADLTGFDLVVGQGEAYAGGYSSAAGTSKKAVEDTVPQVGGVPDAPPPPPPPAAPDLSRPASPLDRDWACAWPEEAQDTELRDARVTVRVTVDQNGSPAHVDVLGGPPGGFAEAARRCAEHERYRVALDTSGKPVPGSTNLFNVHFLR